MSELASLSPQPLWNFFEAICQVPRPSKKEERIREFLLAFAGNHHLEVKTDKVGNVLILKPAVPGREMAPVVVLQTHMDMVCEKDSGTLHDFDNDAIHPVIQGEWVTARGTTLGADCGVGMAAQLAILSADTIHHGPVECLFTVDEETGLTGANTLDPEFLNGKILLNLDSEDEGEIFIGCAGGIDTLGTLTYHPEKSPERTVAFRISVAGLQGGHSGDDIHKGRGNANKILARFLWNITETFNVRIGEMNGGNLRNAIAREASADILLPENYAVDYETYFQRFRTELLFEYQITEPGLQIAVTSISIPEYVIDLMSQRNFLNLLMACPHGVLEMSSRMENMVETSTNLASVKFSEGNKIKITTSQRSEIESRKRMAASMVESVFLLAVAAVEHTDGYPGWTPDPESEILKLTVKSYKKLFGIDPLVKSIHAGLECGLFREKYPELDMVSFGPTIKGAHSPSERVNIPTVEKFWRHLVDLLETIS